MTSPFIVSPQTYSDAPQGGVVMPMIIVGRNPSDTIDTQYDSGYLWLSDLFKGGTGTLFVQSGNVAGSPNWTALDASSGVLSSVLGTTNQITANTAGGVVTLSIPNTFVTPGSIASTSTVTGATGITATTGPITATNGNIVLGTAGNKQVYTSVATTSAAGANSAGSAPLIAGIVTIATTAVTANSLIRLTRQGLNASTSLGELAITSKSAGTNFVITSYTPGAVTTDTTDLSTIFWEIVN